MSAEKSEQEISDSSKRLSTILGKSGNLSSMIGFSGIEDYKSLMNQMTITRFDPQIIGAFAQFTQPRSFLQLDKHIEIMRGFPANLEGAKFLTDLPNVSKAWTMVSDFQASEITKLSAMARKAFEVPSLRSFLPTKLEVGNILSSFNVGIDSESVRQSFESIVGLASIEKAIHFTPYDDLSSNALRTLLGDWTTVSLPAEIFSDWQARMEFYNKLGLDSRLTILPEPAFTTSLYNTGILRKDLFSPAFAVTEVEDPQENTDEKYWVKARMSDAYDLLFTLETQLREYLYERMTERFGAKWETQRVSGELVKAWREKRQEARKKGEAAQPLLWYADFTDYIQIIARKDNWNDIFSDVFVNSIDIQVSFQRLHPIRVCTMHARPITKEDFLLLTVEAHRILKVIGKLNAN